MEVIELNALLPFETKGLKLDGIKRTKTGEWYIYYLNRFGAVQVSASNHSLEDAVLEIVKKLNKYQVHDND